MLNGIPFGERRARWYYFSAIANQGMGNNINAMEHAKRAVEMEPSNMEYRQFLQHLQYGGTWYTSMGSDYDRPYASAGNWCLSLLCPLQLLLFPAVLAEVFRLTGGYRWREMCILL